MTAITKKIFPITLLFFFCQLCQINLFAQTQNFDKNKWKVSADYRYEKAKDSTFHQFLENKNRRQIIKLLGKEDFEYEKRMTYCLDLLSESETNENCKGSFLIIDYNKNVSRKYRVTIVWAN